MATGAVRVRGLKELQRDFRRISKDLTKELTAELKEAADPVKREAEALALSRIRNMPRSPRWAGMRIGVSRAQGVVFMVPFARRRSGSPRPNLSQLLLEEAMDPALERNEKQVLDRVDRMLGRLSNDHGF